MSFNDTLNRFKLVSGLDDSEIVKWIPILKESGEYVRSLLTKDNLTEFDQSRLDKAAGVNAYYKYTVYTSDVESSFSAGDITITPNKDKIKNAKEMWEEEMVNIGDLIGCSSFTFKAVM